MTNEIDHENILDRHTIGEFLAYVNGLRIDADDEDYSDDERADFLAEFEEYDPERVQELQDMYDGTDDDSFVSEDYWDEYAADLADECLLDGVPDTVKNYFDYDQWAQDLTQDDTEFEYDGKAYYCHA